MRTKGFSDRVSLWLRGLADWWRPRPSGTRQYFVVTGQIGSDFRSHPQHEKTSSASTCLLLQPQTCLNNAITFVVWCKGLMLTFSRKEIWFSGCQSKEYTTTSNLTSSINLLMTGTTSAPSWPAGQSRIASVPSIKSFCTSTTTNAETGSKICREKNYYDFEYSGTLFIH